MAVLHITTQRYTDGRGWFSEAYHAERFGQWGSASAWCQDNHSFTARAGTLRGLHFQSGEQAQAKLVRCVAGVIYDVAVDLRARSPTFGRWVAAELSAANGAQLLIPKGFAHGFLTLTDNCEVLYKVDAYYAPSADSGVAWDDPDIGVVWPLPEGCAAPHLSDKDTALPPMAAIEANFLYDGTPLTLGRVVQ